MNNTLHRTLSLCTFFILGTLFLCTFLGSCKPRDILYDHELPQFEVRNDAILLEVIVPIGTAVDEDIYIFGAFNGENDTTVLKHVQWKLEKAQHSDKKWGIYLYPKDFVQGKSLADGFSFASKKAGEERDLSGNTVLHRLNVSAGSRTNIWVDRWASYFDDGQTIRHDGPVVYVLDESGYKTLYLYPYKDDQPLIGPWPGLKQAGTETINGVEFAYFDLGEDNAGLSIMAIFNDNGNSQTQTNAYPLTLEDKVFLHLTSELKVEPYTAEKEEEEPVKERDGARVYVLDGIGWGMSTTLYTYEGGSPIHSSWPGLAVKDTAHIGEFIYLYFDMGEANQGRKATCIFSNSGANQIKDYGPYTIGDDIYLYITTSGATLITDPLNPGVQSDRWYDPTPVPATMDIYFCNLSETAPLMTHVYAYGRSELFGQWPGQAFSTMDSLTVFGIKLYHTQVSCNKQDAYYLIASDGIGSNAGGKQLAAYAVKAQEESNEIYLKITDDKLAPLEVAMKGIRKLIIDN